MFVHSSVAGNLSSAGWRRAFAVGDFFVEDKETRFRFERFIAVSPYRRAR